MPWPAGSCWLWLPRSSGRGEWPTAATRRIGVEVQARRSRSDDEPHRSPIALALSADGTRLLAANQTAGTVSLVDTEVGAGAPRAQDRRQACRRGPLEGRPSRRGHPLVWLRPAPCSRSRTTRSRWPAASRSAPSPAAWRICGRRLDRLRGHRREQRSRPRRSERRAR